MHRRRILRLLAAAAVLQPASLYAQAYRKRCFPHTLSKRIGRCEDYRFG